MWYRKERSGQNSYGLHSPFSLVFIKRRKVFHIVIGSILGQQMYGGLFFLSWVIPRTVKERV
jgi:hypothetical protein